MQLKVFKKLQNYLIQDPFAICKLANITPTWQQAEVLKAFRPGTKIVIKSGHGVGKSLLLALLVFKWLIIRPFTGNPFLANTREQLRDINWKRINEVYNRFPKWFRDIFTITKNRVFVTNYPESWFFAGRTGREDRTEALQGFHNCCFIVDEGSAIPDEIYNVAMAALTEESSTLVIAGNPTRREGFFIDAFKNPNFIKFTFNSEESPLVSDDFIRVMREKYGVESDEYRVRVLGEPPQLDEKEGRLIPDHHIITALKRTEEDIPLDESEPLLMGVDVAYSGRDRSAIAIRQGRVLLEIRVSAPHVGDTMKITEWVIATYEEWKPDRIFVDVNGYGAGVKDRLQQLGFPVVGVMATEKPIFNPELYFQLRDELYFKMRDWFIEGCRIPNSKEFVEELRHIYTDTTTTGKMKIMSKFKLRKIMGKKSPDICDALALTFYPVGKPQLIKRFSRRSPSIRFRKYSSVTGY